MGLGPESLSTLLSEQSLPPDWSAGIFDRNGLIVAHNHNLDRFIGQPAMPALRARISKSPEGWFPSVTKEGIAIYSTFRRSPISGWTVAIGLPREFVDAPLRRTQWLAFGGGATALALSLVLAWWMARAIRRPVDALTADDDPDVRWVTAEYLQEIGHVVADADSGRTALAILERGDPFDLVVIDLAMPGLFGTQTLRLARRIRPDLKAIFCTGYAEISRFDGEIGGDILLKKPFAPGALAEAVRKVLLQRPGRETTNVVSLRRSEQSQSR